MPTAATLVVALALVLDLVFSEFPTRVHPVALFGSLVDRVDRDWRHPRLVGVGIATVLPLLGAGTAAVFVLLAFGVDPVLGTVVAGLVLFSVTSLRMLLDVASDVVTGSDRDLDDARRGLRALAGRDASSLGPDEVRSGAVESLAENLSDGLVAPLTAFAVIAPFSIPLAAGAATWVKAVNTLDSMLGYRSNPVGWASARLDDVVMWVPARLTALCLAVVTVAPDALGRARPLARRTPSPNAGWPMATIAVLLDVRLEKPGVYVLNAVASFPTTADGDRAVRIVRNAGLLAWGGAGVITWF